MFQVYWPVFPRWRLIPHPPWSRFTFARYIFIRLSAFIFIRSAPNRGTKSRHEIATRVNRETAEKLCKIYGSSGGGGGFTGAIEKTERRERRNVREHIKSERCERRAGGWGEVGRHAKSSENDSSLGEMGSRRDFELRGASELPRPPALQRDIAWIRRVKFGRLSAFPREVRKSAWPLTNRRRLDGWYRRSHADNWNTPTA